MRPEVTKAELVTPPAELPVSAAELRSHLHTIYPERNADSDMEVLIKAATNHVQQVTWRKLVSQVWRLYLDSWPVDGIRLPYGSVLAVGKVLWLDDEAVDHELIEGTDYIPAIVGPEPMVLPTSYGWPSGVLFDVDSIRVEFTAGYGVAAEVPDDLRHAIKMLAAHWYEVREAVMVGTTVREVPLAVRALINPYKIRYC